MAFVRVQKFNKIQHLCRVLKHFYERQIQLNSIGLGIKIALHPGMKKLILSFILLVAGNAFSKSIEFHGVIDENIELKAIGYYQGPCKPNIPGTYTIFSCSRGEDKLEIAATYSNTAEKGKKYYRIQVPSKSKFLYNLVSGGLVINNKFSHIVEGINLKPEQHESLREVSFATQFIYSPGGFLGSYYSMRNPGVFSKVILLKNGNIQLVSKSGDLVTPENWHSIDQEYRKHQPLENDLLFNLDIEAK